jgi:hypothetical protein
MRHELGQLLYYYLLTLTSPTRLVRESRSLKLYQLIITIFVISLGVQGKLKDFFFQKKAVRVEVCSQNLVDLVRFA